MTNTKHMTDIMHEECYYLHKYRSLAAVWEAEYPSEDPLPETQIHNLLLAYFMCYQM